MKVKKGLREVRPSLALPRSANDYLRLWMNRNSFKFVVCRSYLRTNNHRHKQESIPVGCVPPARYRTGGSPWARPPGQRPPWTETPSPRQRPPGQRPHLWTETPLWTEWHTGVKILPCRNFVAGSNNPVYKNKLQMYFFSGKTVSVASSLYCVDTMPIQFLPVPLSFTTKA